MSLCSRKAMRVGLGLGYGLVALSVAAWPVRAPVRGQETFPRKDDGKPAAAKLWVDAERGRAVHPARKASRASTSPRDRPPPRPADAFGDHRGRRRDVPHDRGPNMPADRLELMRRMRPGVKLRIVGVPGADNLPPRLAWEGGTAMIHACEGEWSVENVQVGTGSTRQRRGVLVTGPARVTLENVTFRTRSQSDAAIYADRGGLVLLRARFA